MKFPNKLIKAKILKRYKRFLSDIELDDGTIVNAHVPNTGSMKTCWGENWDVYLSESDNPKRKLKYTLEMTHNSKTLICVNTNMTNKLVKEAFQQKKIAELMAYDNIKPEQKVFESRIDFYLTQENLPDAYVEVKNVTLDGGDGLALFPDSVTTRGQKHLKDLMRLKAQGHRAVMLYIVNREDVYEFSPAKDIDPTYAALVKEAKDVGVEMLVYRCRLTPEEIYVDKKLEMKL
jgi:sugar fermentation stimulation protein A